MGKIVYSVMYLFNNFRAVFITQNYEVDVRNEYGLFMMAGCPVSYRVVSINEHHWYPFSNAKYLKTCLSTVLD